MPRAEWYSDGLRFECTQCGACCTGPTGYVSFTEREGREMAARVGLAYAAFLDRYAHRVGSGWSLNEVETEHGMDCVFLDRESAPGKAVCSLHEERPAQCRTWPFWPENLRDRRAWERAGRKCEGIGRGPVVRVEEIRIDRDGTPGAP